MKALVLAGGIPQIKLIEKLREMFSGIEIILADYLDHPAAESYADKFYRKSTLDIAAIEAIAVCENVDFLITVCTDQALNTVAEVSERLHLPCYINAQTGKNVTNKLHMKKVFERNGIPTARYIVTSSELTQLPIQLRFPVIVKPVDCNSSKGVIKVDDRCSLETAIKNAIKYSRTNSAIVEEYIRGRELSIDVFVEGTNPIILCIMEIQKIKSDDKFIIHRGVYPAHISQQMKEKIFMAIQKIVVAFQLANCPMLVQLICEEEDVSIVEFSARTGGGLKFKTIEMVSGVDIISETINATFNRPNSIESVNYATEIVITESLYCNKGIFDHIEGIQKLKNSGTITDYYVYKKRGECVGGADSSGDRVAGVIISAGSYEELKNKYDVILKEIKVIEMNGVDILRRDIISSPIYKDIPGQTVRKLPTWV